MSILLALLALGGCIAETPTPVLIDPSKFVTYAHPTGVFSLDLPPDWVVNDTSDAYAIHVAFSPPDSPEPLLVVYVVSLSAMGTGSGGESVAQGDVANPEIYLEAYRAVFHAEENSGTYKEMGHDLQPDGSLRVQYVIESPQAITQHNDFLQVAAPYFVVLRTSLPADIGQLRTLNRIINTLRINQSASWASLVEGGENTASREAISFASLNAWVDRNGGFEIVGQVLNNTSAPLEFVRITAQLYDEANRLLAEQDDFVSSDLIRPGEYAPFSIVFSDGLPPGTIRYDLSASARYADYTTQTFYGPENFALTSQAEIDENGLLVISGQVRNEGTQTANLVKVIVAIFDEQQRIIATDTTLVDVQRLEPGETSLFKVTFVELGGVPHRFLVTTQGILEGQ